MHIAHQNASFLNVTLCNLKRFPGPCVSTAICHCHNTFNQWHCSFHWKLHSHWLQVLWQHHIVVVISGAVLGLTVACDWDVHPRDILVPDQRLPFALLRAQTLRLIQMSNAFKSFKLDILDVKDSLASPSMHMSCTTSMLALLYMYIQWQ